MIDRSLVSINNRIVTIDPYSLIVIRNGKRKDPSIKFILSGNLIVQINDLLNSNTRAISILSISDIKAFVPIFYLYYKIQKVYLGYSQERYTFPPSNKRLQLPKLTLCKYSWFISSGVIRLRYRSCYKRYIAILLLVNIIYYRF